MKSNIKNEFFDYENCLYESMIALKRAGSNAIISYHALEMARIIKNHD